MGRIRQKRNSGDKWRSFSQAGQDTLPGDESTVLNGTQSTNAKQGRLLNCLILSWASDLFL